MINIDQLNLTDKVKQILIDNKVDLDFVTYDDLLELDGVGPATAGDVMMQLIATRNKANETIKVKSTGAQSVTIRNNSNRKLVVPINLVIDNYPAELSQSYEFGPNAQLEVNAVDAEILLMLRVSQQSVCCGAVATSRPLFVSV